MIIGGTMCPTFMATGDEKACTRARANILRAYLSEDENNVWDHKEIYEVLDLCISCKGCKSECPSGVDIAKLKAEFLQHWYDKHGIPLRTRLIAYISSVNKAGSLVPGVFNFFISNRIFSQLIKSTIGFARKRTIPLLFKTTLRKWIERNIDSLNPDHPIGSVCLFVDEFTNFNDVPIGITTIKLLTSLGYKVVTADHCDSGRTFLSKGLVRKARKIARENIIKLSGIIGPDLPLIGIEPSAIMCFRDEYPELSGSDLKKHAENLSDNCFTLEEFFAREYRADRIKPESFTENSVEVLLHAHCQQKAVSSSSYGLEMLSIPIHYTVKEIPSGCCGMAGSFGYEKEHYDLSNSIGEMVLFPEVRNAADNIIIAAPGTSCRHHIKDGTGRIAMHPAEILYRALRR
jgi:Fe-S oxidoreductase